ncbi:PAS domain-containing sensor histidine kinase [Pokkaliibacter plantistimulans]|uniref:Phosphate regulon sensor protein PhoR n=1 Tax=Proteobacteria bacterium 228 TaxID=2083153 RepID=A0A2S5KSD2_9PROT|nr:phosphate regulon sensor histidine kinase PhoR [Pokkaliibacter plantistimulans]PPC77754.1 PAS domain-containing sensor histidine kinase [Pokkaliibacter plantistimulans]
MRSFLGRQALVLLGCTLVGALSGYALLGLSLGLAGLLGWQLWHFQHLVRWLAKNSSEKDDVPEGKGLWGDIFDELYRLQKRNLDEHDRLRGIIARIQDSTSALKDGVVLLDEDGALEWWNQAASRLLGLRYPQDRGQPITHLLRRPDFVRYFDRCRYQEPLEVPAPTNSDQYLQISITLFGKGDRLMLVQDVTRLHNLEKMRQDFVANASHELRTPLTVISGYLETLGDHLDQLPRPWVRPIQQMGKQAKRMENLIADLLTLSRLETSQIEYAAEPVDMDHLLHQILHDAEALGTDKGQTITLEAEPGLCLHGREQELHSALSNLVMNAVKYTPDEGKIQIRWRRQGEGAVFEVQDNGIGIDPIHIPRLTERFYRADPSRTSESGGTGLGLAIVKHVLLRHEATLQIESQLGKGSLFRAKFPASLLVSLEQEA